MTSQFRNLKMQNVGAPYQHAVILPRMDVVYT